MPKVRFSGVVRGEDDPNRRIRARLLYRLFNAGWDIYNGNGDQEVTLGNIQKKIIESDAFIFTPGATLEDMFKAASIFVGLQTNDCALLGKPVVVVNKDGSWDPFISLVEHLHEMGTVSQTIDTFISFVNRPKEVLQLLQYDLEQRCDLPKENVENEKYSHEQHSSRAEPDFNVCVFCSASIKKAPYLQAGLDLGAMLAEENWGCVSGAGNTGIMGSIVTGANQSGGWTAGSNVPHIIEMEGLPEGLDMFWPRMDIYTRMEIMIEKSDSFVVMPGGMGTFQELLALILMLQQDSPLMRGKSIVIVNRVDEETGKPFWDPLVDMLKSYNVSERCTFVSDIKDIIPTIKNLHNL